MLSNRQEEILKIIVESYVKTVEPISSNNICSILNVSSATVRNDMAALEKFGFIEKPHYASGRIPTEDGYRYYVDKMLSVKVKLASKESKMIQSLFDKNGLILQDAICESVRLISELTNYSVVMLGNSSHAEVLREVKVLEIDSHSLVTIIITNTGKVFNKVVKVDETLVLAEIEEVVETINKLLVGTPLIQVTRKLEEEISPVIQRFIEQHKAIYEAFIKSIIEVSNNKDIMFEGRDKIIDFPEFDDIDLIRKFIKELNDETLLQLISYSDDINIKIGHDNHVSSELSVVTASYSSEGDKTSVAVIGPKRMDYNRVVGLLQEIKSNLERMNKESTDE